MDEKTAMKAALKVQIISLNARLLAAESFILNQSLQVEARLLGAQVKALESVLLGFENMT